MPLTHRGYGAYVSCNGRELEHSQVKTESDTVMSCYIPGDGGGEYKVHWVDSKPPTHLSVEIRADGRRIGVVSHTKESTKSTPPGLRIPLNENCTSKFLHVPETDDGLPFAYSEELGTVEVKLRRVRAFISVPVTPKPPATSGPSRGRAVSSRGPAKRTSIGQNKTLPPKATVLRPILIDDKPYVVFRFLYRPREVLEANGITRSKGQDSSTPASTVPKGRRKRVSAVVPVSPTTPQPSTKRQRLSPDAGDHLPADEDDMYLDEVPPTANPDLDDPGVDNSCVHYQDPHFKAENHVGDSAALGIPPENAGSDPYEEEDERAVEVHLSSRNGYMHRTSPSPVRVKQEAGDVVVKREPSPAPAGFPFPSDPCAEDIKPKLEDEEEASVVEIHVNSKNQHLVFDRGGRSHGMDVMVKKEEPSEVPFTPAVKCEEATEEIVVEVHLSPKDIHRAFDGVISAKVEQ